MSALPQQLLRLCGPPNLSRDRPAGSARSCWVLGKPCGKCYPLRLFVPGKRYRQ